MNCHVSDEKLTTALNRVPEDEGGDRQAGDQHEGRDHADQHRDDVALGTEKRDRLGVGS